MDAKALPFATYDVAVYLPGGAIILILAAQALTGVQALTGLDIGIDPPFLNSKLTSSDTVNGFIEAIFWLGFSYLVGHLAAFISTYVVERPLHNWLGYPSELWLERENLAEDQASAKEFEQNFWKRYDTYTLNPSTLVGLLWHIPVLPFLAIFKAIRPSGFYIPKLPYGQKDRVAQALSRSVGRLELSATSRWEKFAEHYVACNHPRALARMYNYLVIYGALRLLAFILLCCAWWVMLTNTWIAVSAEHAAVSWIKAAAYVIISLLYVLSAMAFAKFNRRYFEESIYSILLTQDPAQDAVTIKVG